MDINDILQILLVKYWKLVDIYPNVMGLQFSDVSKPAATFHF